MPVYNGTYLKGVHFKEHDVGCTGDPWTTAQRAALFAAVEEAEGKVKTEKEFVELAKRKGWERGGKTCHTHYNYAKFIFGIGLDPAHLTHLYEALVRKFREDPAAVPPTKEWPHGFLDRPQVLREARKKIAQGEPFPAELERKARAPKKVAERGKRNKRGGGEKAKGKEGAKQRKGGRKETGTKREVRRGYTLEIPGVPVSYARE